MALTWHGLGCGRRESHSAVLDEQRGQLLVFGGNSGAGAESDAGPDFSCAAGITYLNDLWALHVERRTWQRLEPRARVG